VKITVALCTWNRAALLDATLTSMASLRVPTGTEWELLVVDNNSTDQTPQIIEKHRANLPLVALHETRAGKSYAANLAAARATGELLVWTDDDVLVPENWLLEYARAAAAWPDAEFFAGSIEPWFESSPPEWITRHLSELTGVYVIVDHGSTERPLNRGEAVFGANMAFRIGTARAFPLNPRLGRIRGSLIGGDDTELVERVFNAGHSGVWVPTARLRHFVPSERLTAQYIQRWFRDAGRNFVIQKGLDGGRRIASVPTWVIRQYMETQCRRGYAAAIGGSAWFQHFKRAAMLRGVMAQARARE
jgi:glycosyltransferase involved in cell wall biosynthesis